MSEWALIEKLKQHLPTCATKGLMPLPIGDDCAVIVPEPEQHWVVCTDVLNEGVHFPVGTAPGDIGWKALAVNLSDLAACGAEPKYMTMTLSLPEPDQAWVDAFALGMKPLMEKNNVVLAGGDTTRGPLSVGVQLIGQVPSGEALTRSGAQKGDDIYVSGFLGEAAAGLDLILKKNCQMPEKASELILKLNRPKPQVELGLNLRKQASACIDISDGLLADLGHILSASGVGAEIYLEQLPCSELMKSFERDQAENWILSGGDDYELCFTLSEDKAESLGDVLKGCFKIGKVLSKSGLHLKRAGLEVNHQQFTKGYQHFVS